MDAGLAGEEEAEDTVEPFPFSPGGPVWCEESASEELFGFAGLKILVTA